MVHPPELPHLPPNPRRLYVAIASSEFLAKMKESKAFLAHCERNYYARRDRYEGVFLHRIAFTHHTCEGNVLGRSIPNIDDQKAMTRMYYTGNRKLLKSHIAVATLVVVLNGQSIRLKSRNHLLCMIFIRAE